MTAKPRPAQTLRSIALYTLAIGLVSGGNFLTAPLLVSLLGASEFARWSLLEPILMMGVALAGFGIHIGLISRITGEAQSDRRVVAGLLPYFLLLTVLIGVLGGGVVWWAGESTIAALLIVAIIVAEGIMAFAANLWRAQDRAGLFAFFEGGRAVIAVAVLTLAAVGVVFSFGNAEDYLGLRAAVGTLAVAAGLVLIRPAFHPDAVGTRRALAFGGPIVLASLCSTVLVNVDRYALAQTANDATLAVYVAHVKLAQVLGTAVSPFYAWLAPKAMQHLEAGREDHHFFASVTSIFVVVVYAGCANLWLIGPTAWSVLFPMLGFDRLLYAFLLVGMAVYALGNPVSIGVLRPGKTYQALLVTLLSVIVAAGACFASARYGVIGVSLGRAIGLACYTALFGIVTVRSLGIDYRWKTHALLALFLIATVWAIEALVPAGNLLSLGARLLILNCLLLGILIVMYWRRGQ